MIIEKCLVAVKCEGHSVFPRDLQQITLLIRPPPERTHHCIQFTGAEWVGTRRGPRLHGRARRGAGRAWLPAAVPANTQVSVQGLNTLDIVPVCWRLTHQALMSELGCAAACCPRPA